MAAQFAVTDKVKWFGVFRESAVDQTPDFLQPAGAQHGLCATVNTFVQGFAFWLQANFKNAPASQRPSSRLMYLGKRLLRQQANFDRANQFLFISRRNLCGGCSVEPRKHLMQVSGAMLQRRSTQTIAKFFRSQRQVR